MAEVTFLQQTAPIDEYGRALYAVSRSIVRAHLDQMTPDDLGDLGVDRDQVTLRQLAKFARLEPDKGMKGDGFEWAVHEALIGGEPRVTTHVSELLRRVSRHMDAAGPSSVLFGHERAQYLGFLDAVIETAGHEAVLLPDGRGHPYAFGPWVSVAARGVAAEPELTERIKQIWKTDLFLTDREAHRYIAATIKSNHKMLEGGRGLRIGIVPEAKDYPQGIRWNGSLWVLVLPDPHGFMGLFNDAYSAVAQAICTLGKHDRPPYFLKPSATAERVQTQLEKYPTARVVDIEAALDEAAQQDLLDVEHKLVSVKPPPWLHMVEKQEMVIAPKPTFEKLD